MSTLPTEIEPPAPGPLSHLRSLRKEGVGRDPAGLRRLLATMSDPLDIDAAGALLGTEAVRAALREAGGFHERKIAVLGSSTLDMMPNLLNAMLLRAGIVAEFAATGFDQWRFEIMAGAPTLASFAPDLVICLLDEGVLFEAAGDLPDIAAIEARCAAFAAELTDWAMQCRRLARGTLVLATIPLSPRRSRHRIDYAGKARLSEAWARMNADILAIAGKVGGVVVLDGALLAAEAGSVDASDRMRLAAGHAYSPGYLAAFAKEAVHVCRADLGLAKKALALDLDNTLWGGVVGDVGVGPLALGRAWPGAPHRELQLLAKAYATQGVILTICSKNDAGVARNAIASHPEMVLGEGDISLLTANWEPKAQNLKAQAQTLNIGTDAFVFMDDHPVERDAMRSFLPEVETIELGSDPSGYASALAESGAFNLIALTSEDRARTEIYRAQAARAATAGTISMEDYLQSLDSHLMLEPLGDLNAMRITQLFGKTNQFNLTGRRYSEAELRDPSRRTFGARLTDRFGDNGLIAAITLSDGDDGAAVIENAVLSCRVFSRGVEEAVMSLILCDAKERGLRSISGRYVPSAKNGRCASFFADMGFAPAGDGWSHDLGDIIAVPDWMNISVSTGAAHAE